MEFKTIHKHKQFIPRTPDFLGWAVRAKELRGMFPKDKKKNHGIIIKKTPVFSSQDDYWQGQGLI